MNAGIMFGLTGLLRRFAAALALGAAPILAGGSAQAMSFRLVPFDTGACDPQCLQIIEATGEIRQDSAERFAAFVRPHIGKARIATALVVHSPGGHVGGALRLGFVLRRLGVTTIVGCVGANAARIADGRCASACVYLFMGGKARYIPEGSLLGVHAMADVPSARDVVGSGSIGPKVSEESASAVLRQYAQMMGVSPAIVELGQQTPHSSIRVLTQAEIARLKLGSRRLPR
jgi:hypothetical protein